MHVDIGCDLMKETVIGNVDLIKNSYSSVTVINILRILDAKKQYIRYFDHFFYKIILRGSIKSIKIIFKLVFYIFE